MDRFERPELVLGTYEFLATAEYCRNNTLPKPPAVIFVIDVSYNNIKSGLVHLLCAQMKDIIKNLPVDQGQEKSNMRVGFITYNSSVHFYNIKVSVFVLCCMFTVVDFYLWCSEGEEMFRAMFNFCKNSWNWYNFNCVCFEKCNSIV